MIECFEKWALSADPQIDINVPIATAQSAIQSGYYKKTILGLKAGEHYSKKFDHSRFHLRITEGAAFLHWDEYDPEEYPILHFFETKELIYPALFALTIFYFIK